MKLMKNIWEKLKNQQILYWIFIAMFILPNVIMFFTESTSTLVRITNILLPLSVYWWAMTLNKKPGKMFWWLYLFAFLAAFQIVLLYLYGESPIAVDMFLNVTTTNPTETTELLTNLLPAVIFVLVIYIGGMILAVLSILNKEVLSSRFRSVQRKVALVLMGTAVLFVGFSYFFDRKFAIQNDIFPINGVYNLGLSVDRTTKSFNYEKNAANFKYNSKCVHPDTLPEVYVLVVGETLRADNLSLYGYERNTTPLLGAMRNDLAVYRDAITMSNTTHKSVPLILTSVGSQTSFDGIYNQKGIISAFKEAGYSTAFYSCQSRNHSIIDFLGQEADDVIYMKDGLSMMAQLPDTALIAKVKQKLNSYKGDKLFIVLHCYGSHFNYSDRYARPGGSYFKPDDIPSASKKYRDKMMNAYDNSVRHADMLLAGVIGALKEKHISAGLVYVSDHGEDIFDDSRLRFLHSSPIPTYYQLRVPFIVWTSPEYRAQFPEKWQALLENRDLPISTNRITFHTVLDLGGISTKYFKPTEAVSNANFKTSQRRYVNDHNEYRFMDDCGLKDLDVEQFKKHGLKFP